MYTHVYKVYVCHVYLMQSPSRTIKSECELKINEPWFFSYLLLHSVSMTFLFSTLCRLFPCSITNLTYSRWMYCGSRIFCSRITGVYGKHFVVDAFVSLVRSCKKEIFNRSFRKRIAPISIMTALSRNMPDTSQNGVRSIYRINQKHSLI